jgi:hypothetical protein
MSETYETPALETYGAVCDITFGDDNYGLIT